MLNPLRSPYKSKRMSGMDVTSINRQRPPAKRMAPVGKPANAPKTRHVWHFGGGASGGRVVCRLCHHAKFEVEFYRCTKAKP